MQLHTQLLVGWEIFILELLVAERKLLAHLLFMLKKEKVKE